VILEFKRVNGFGWITTPLILQEHKLFAIEARLLLSDEDGGKFDSVKRFFPLYFQNKGNGKPMI